MTSRKMSPWHGDANRKWRVTEDGALQMPSLNGHIVEIPVTGNVNDIKFYLLCNDCLINVPNPYQESPRWN